MRLWSGSLKYREVMVPTAPVLSTGPSSISIPQACNNSLNEPTGLDLSVTWEMWWQQVRYLQMCGYLGQRGSGDETQVSGA